MKLSKLFPLVALIGIVGSVSLQAQANEFLCSKGESHLLIRVERSHVSFGKSAGTLKPAKLVDMNAIEGTWQAGNEYVKMHAGMLTITFSKDDVAYASYAVFKDESAEKPDSIVNFGLGECALQKPAKK